MVADWDGLKLWEEVNVAGRTWNSHKGSARGGSGSKIPKTPTNTRKAFLRKDPPESSVGVRVETQRNMNRLQQHLKNSTCESFRITSNTTLSALAAELIGICSEIRGDSGRNKKRR